MSPPRNIVTQPEELDSTAGSSPTTPDTPSNTKKMRSRIPKRKKATPQKPASRRQIRARALLLKEVPIELVSFYNNDTPDNHLPTEQSKIMFDIAGRCRALDCTYEWRKKRIRLNAEHVSKHLNHNPYRCSTWSVSFYLIQRRADEIGQSHSLAVVPIRERRIIRRLTTTSPTLDIINL
jgi:hypothetical protein